MTAERLPGKPFGKNKNGPAPSKVEDNAHQDRQDFVDIPPLEFPDLGAAKDETVTKDQCILHLKLLAALADLRATVSTVDGLFGIHDSQADKFGDDDDDEMAKRRALIRIREKRWEVYTSRAVDRYVDWWMKIVPAGELPTVSRIIRLQSAIIGSHPLMWSAKDLPPLDVLMVWHAHMLNPRAYLEDCIRASKMALWNTEFPWQLIDDAIDTKTFDYNPGQEAIKNFTGITGRLWDNLDESEEKKLKCLLCSRQFYVPWTTAEIGYSPDYAFEKCTGYADSGFKAYCECCTLEHNHQVLRVARFNKDVGDLLAFDRPMPGTYLNLEGIPNSLQQFSFPNALIKAGNRTVYGCIEPGGNVTDMYGVRRLIEAQIGNFSLMQSINNNNKSGQKVKLTKVQKISIRRMMSHYWENSSIFGLDLVGAVIRQGTFIQKMDNLDWLHSPALSTTMDRLIRKYTTFLAIIFKHPGKMAVPTLDVDLAWHTHQMSPCRYYVYTTTRSGQHGVRTFINHDDKVDEGKLSDAFEWTSKEYKLITNGELYSECTCWYCEATREPILYSANNTMLLLSSSTRHSRTLAKNLHNDPRISSELDKNPHISAHNAVRSATVESLEDMRMLRLRRLWDKASRRAQKRSDKEEGNAAAATTAAAGSSAVDAYYPMVWGYPYYLPLYAPYMVDPSISTGPYPGNPGWMNTDIGGYGNCVTGTCTNVVAAGECAAQNGGPRCGSVFDNMGNLVSDVSGGGGCGGGCGSGGCGGGCGS